MAAADRAAAEAEQRWLKRSTKESRAAVAGSAGSACAAAGGEGVEAAKVGHGGTTGGAPLRLGRRVFE